MRWKIQDADEGIKLSFRTCSFTNLTYLTVFLVLFSVMKSIVATNLQVFHKVLRSLTVWSAATCVTGRKARWCQIEGRKHRFWYHNGVSRWNWSFDCLFPISVLSWNECPTNQITDVHQFFMRLTPIGLRANVNLLLAIFFSDSWDGPRRKVWLLVVKCI